MNPFETEDHITYADYIKSLFEDKTIGDTFEVEMRGKGLQDIRSYIQRYAPSFKCRTTIGKDGKFYLKIIGQK